MTATQSQIRDALDRLHAYADYDGCLQDFRTVKSALDTQKPAGDVGDALDMVRYLLPLAKGYVHANPGIRSTECIIEDAEAMLSAAPEREG